MSEELRENAKQHGVAVADSLNQRLRTGSITPARASELLNAYMVKQAEAMLERGFTRDELVVWIRCVEAAFDDRLSELAGQEPPAGDETKEKGPGPHD
jgi:hypothetical protein